MINMKTNDDRTGFEKLSTTVFSEISMAIQSLAGEIASLIRERADKGQTVVMGLATGSTPVPLYRELIRMHREDKLSFENVITFNLDEYYPLEPGHPESYHRFMHEQLFDHIDIPADNIHIPCGNCSREEVFGKCADYEAAIEAHGGIDIQILGIGRTGHIGFNEPGSSLSSKTRLVTLDSITRSDAAKDFLGESNVPRHAITMGIGSILAARKIYMLAWGRSKAEILRKAVEEDPQESVPASFLQSHGNVHVITDEAAAVELTRNKYPWLVGFPEWTAGLIRRAVSDLSLKLGKPLLKLVDKDYQENGLADLVTEHGPAYNLNIKVFNELQHTITGWPGGKPHTDDQHRPERAEPAHKRVVVFSPEPLDDMLAMAGTLNRLVTQGHEVTVAYLTSGNLGVPDGEVRSVSELILEAGYSDPDSLAVKVSNDLEQKGAFDQDSASIRKLKGIVRRNEARASLEICGLRSCNVKFLDLPFYEHGKYRQFTTGKDDVSIVKALLEEKLPHQVFFTGASADPSSVNSKSFEVMKEAVEQLADESWITDCYFWQYATGNKEWEVDQIDMAVPCSPDELAKKIQSIYQHRSQMSQVPLMQSKHKEIWEQTQDRNRDTASRYDSLGLAEYEAIECFGKWK